MGFDAAEFAAGHKSKDLWDASDLNGAQVWQKIATKVAELKRSGYLPDATRH